MIRNIATPERLIRGLTGILLLGLYGAIPSPWRYLSLIGLLPLGTALTGNCPVYTMIGRRGLGPGGSDEKPPE